MTLSIPKTVQANPQTVQPLRALIRALLQRVLHPPDPPNSNSDVAVKEGGGGGEWCVTAAYGVAPTGSHAAM